MPRSFLLFGYLVVLAAFACSCDSVSPRSENEHPEPDSTQEEEKGPENYSAGSHHEAVIQGISWRGQATEEVALAHPPMLALDLNKNGKTDLVTGLAEQNMTYVFLDVEELSEGHYDASGADLVIRGACLPEGCAALGEPFARGDVNGDGFDDLIVGDRMGSEGNGRAYVIYATSELPTGEAAVSKVADLEVSFEGHSSYPDHFGEALITADLNGDGFDDLLIGAPVSRITGSGRGRGSVSVIYGRDDLPERMSAPSEADLFLRGRSDYDHLGMYLAAGDWNGDGYEDAALSAFDDFSRSGAVWILYGRADSYAGSFRIDDASALRVSVFEAAERGDEMAYVASGDLNGDGRDDLVLGAGRAGTTGKAYANFGPIPAGSRFTAGQFSRGLTLAPAAQAENGGVFAGSGFGRALFAHDLDGDGRDELLAGAKGYTPPRPNAQDVRNVGGAFLFDLGGAEDGVGFSDLLACRFYGNNDGTRATLPNVEFGRAVTMFRLNSAKYVAVLDEVRDSSIYLFNIPDAATN